MPASDLKIVVTVLAAALVALAAVPAPASAGQSTITEAEGRACMGEDHSRKETQDQALADAKRMAAESAPTHIRSETTVKNLALEKDLVEAYTRADVRMLGVLESAWYEDEHIGDCHRVRIRAEVVPDEQGMRRLAEDEAGAASDPTAPRGIKVWTSQAAYRSGEKMRIFLRANKPFFGRVLYEQANGAAVQLLPNPFRSADDFLG